MAIEKDKLAAQIRAARATLDALEADLDRAKVSRCSFTGQNGSRIAPVIGSRDAEALTKALQDIEMSADDGDGWTSDGHERCVGTAQQVLSALAAKEGEA